MTNRWTFGRAIAAGFAAILALNLAAGLITLVSLRNVVASKDRVIEVDAQLQTKSQELRAARSERAAAIRAFLLTGEDLFRAEIRTSTDDFNTVLAQTKRLIHTERGHQLLEQVATAASRSMTTQDQLLALKERGGTLEEVSRAFHSASTLQLASLKSAVNAFNQYERQLADDGVQASSATARRDLRIIGGVVIGTIVLTTALAVALTRRLRHRIGSAVGEVRSWSSELQTTANQQVHGAGEQATAMSEISTTITELLATSRQITESAQRVSDVADQTADAGRSGRATVSSAQESMVEIRRQVDLIVNHMLELGDKSQRIGAVLDIVSELAEQTNILAINSTIEAAGAGDSGRRFAVVADEIRKLADRVADSTKEIRNMIDVVRGAVHTTVMATEIGSKAVDTGTAQFADVASSFEQIVALVTTTTQAARDIELSTKQQTTAVEQVNFAVANVTQTTKETETNSSQTLQTASQLSELSTNLRRLVEPVAGA